jgi:hypothetical protein
MDPVEGPADLFTKSVPSGFGIWRFGVLVTTGYVAFLLAGDFEFVPSVIESVKFIP